MLLPLIGAVGCLPGPGRAGPERLDGTPLYEDLMAKGAVFGQFGGWERAFWFNPGRALDEHALSFHDEPWFSAVKTECETVRDGVGIMDHGGFAKFEVSGTGAAAVTPVPSPSGAVVVRYDRSTGLSR